MNFYDTFSYSLYYIIQSILNKFKKYNTFCRCKYPHILKIYLLSYFIDVGEV